MEKVLWDVGREWGCHRGLVKGGRRREREKKMLFWGGVERLGIRRVGVGDNVVVGAG